jgi:hypothetical protein
MASTTAIRSARQTPGKMTMFTPRRTADERASKPLPPISATARGLLRMLAACSAPCSVNACGSRRRPPRPAFDIAHCDIHPLADPGGTFPGDAFLLQSIGELQPIGIDHERFLLCLLRIERVEESWFAEEEIQMLDRVEVHLEGIVGVDGEIGRNDREPGARLNARLEEVGNHTASVIVPDVGVACRIGHRWAGFYGSGFRMTSPVFRSRGVPASATPIQGPL